MTLEGCTALSVEMKTKFRTPNSSARSATHLVPPTLFWTASPMLHSISGTCLWAAAWKTTSGRYSWKSCRIRGWSVTLAMQVYNAVAVRMACKPALDLEDAVLAAADQHQRAGIEAQHLAADFRADAPAGAGDHDRAALEELADHLGVQLDGGAPQQVADFDVADGNAMVAAEAVFQAADDLQVQAGLLAVVHQVPQPRPGQGAGNHQDVGRLGAGGDFPHVFQLPQHGDLAQPRFLRLFRAEKAADAIGQLAVGLDLVGQHAVGMIGADQQGPAGVALVEHRPELFPVHPPASPQRPQHHDGAAAVQEWQVPCRKDRGPGREGQDNGSEEVVDGDDAEHRQDGSADQGDQVGEGHVGPPAVIMAQEEEDQELDRHDPGQPGPELRRLAAAGTAKSNRSRKASQKTKANTARCPTATAQKRGAASRWAC